MIALISTHWFGFIVNNNIASIMQSINHYKEKFWEYSNEELKDIIAGRFKEASDNEVAAAIALLKERKPSQLSLAEISNASMPVLVEIIKNPSTWGEEAVAVAEAEILRREQPVMSAASSDGKKTFFQILLAIVGVILSVILLKILAGIFVLLFLFYCAISCLNGL